jgi:hypothetical protein
MRTLMMQEPYDSFRNESTLDFFRRRIATDPSGLVLDVLFWVVLIGLFVGAFRGLSRAGRDPEILKVWSRTRVAFLVCGALCLAFCSLLFSLLMMLSLGSAKQEPATVTKIFAWTVILGGPISAFVAVGRTVSTASNWARLRRQS